MMEGRAVTVRLCKMISPGTRKAPVKTHLTIERKALPVNWRPALPGEWKDPDVDGGEHCDFLVCDCSDDNNVIDVLPHDLISFAIRECIFTILPPRR